jgi:hypothetical protein
MEGRCVYRRMGENVGINEMRLTLVVAIFIFTPQRQVFGKMLDVKDAQGLRRALARRAKRLKPTPQFFLLFFT